MRQLTKIGLGALLSILAIFEVVMLSKNSATQPTAGAVPEKESEAEKSVEFHSKTDLYVLDRHIKAILQDPQRGDRNFADLHYRGVFSVEATSADRARIAFELDDHVVSSVPFEVTLGHGKVGAIRVGKAKDEAEEESLNILKDFVSLFAYQSTEDTTGVYEAQFSTRDGIVTKKKTRYAISESSTEIQSSLHEIRIDASGELLSATGRETTRVRAGRSSTLATTSEYTLTRKGEKNEVSVASVPRKMAEDKSARVVKDSSLALHASRNDRFIPWKQLVGRLNQMNELPQSARLTLFHDLVNTAKKEEGGLDAFEAWVGPHLENPDMRTFAIGVLATLGGADAQHALLDWYQQFPDSRTVILNALTTTTALLSDEVHSFLTGLSDQKSAQPDIAYSAAFALGSALQNDTRVADVSHLQSLYQNAANPTEQSVYLDAMGNSGSALFLPNIKDALAATDDSVRTEAVLAMRLMQNNDTQNLLQNAWTDPSLKVKSAMLQVIQVQGSAGNYQTILKQCVQETPELKGVCAQLL